MVIDADVLARQVVRPGKPAWRDIVREYGPRVIQTDRTLNRQALAQIVFRHPHELQKLNAIVHPRVARVQARLVREMKKKNPQAVVIYDAPLLIEAGAYKRMDKIIVVVADHETQLIRSRARNHFSRNEAMRRIRAQLPLRVKKESADFVLDGTLAIEQLRLAVRRIYSELRRMAKRHRGD